MENQKTPLAMADNEINLFDIWRILSERKWLVIIMPIITISLAVIYLLLTKPTFEYTAQILVGQMQKGTEKLLDPNVIVQQLKDKYQLNDRISKKKYPRLSNATLNKKDTGNIVILKSEAITPIESKKYALQIAEEVNVEQKRLFDIGIKIKNDQLKSITERIEDFNKYQIELDKHIETTSKQNPTQAAVLAIEKGGALETLVSLENQKYVLQSAMSELESYPAKLLWEPPLPEKPVRPKRALILLLAGLSGLILGIMIAFFSEYIGAARRQVTSVAR